MPSRRQVEVGVGQDDDPVLAAELEADPLESSGGDLGDALAGQGVAGEADDLGVGAGDQCVADRGARAGDQVDRARREAGLGHELDQERRAVGRVARRFEHDGIAGHQSGHHLPARDGHREVPGGHDGGDPERLADAHRPLVGQLGGGRVAEQPAALAGHQEGDVDALLDVAARLGQDLAHLAGHRSGQPLLVLGHERPERVQDLAPLRGRRPAPCLEGDPSGPDRPGGVGDVGGLEPADHVAGVGRVAALERLARDRIDPLAADEQLERGSGDGLGHGQTLSNAMATEPPPPRHRVARP